MPHTIIITEETMEMLRDVKEMTEYKFISNVKAFLSRLMDDPVHADVPDTLALNGYDRRRMIAVLRKNNIIERHEKISDKDENGNPKKATMIVSYKVPKNNLDRKLKKLYIKLFEENVPPKDINESFLDDLALMKGSPLTMGVIAPSEGEHPSPEVWLMNRAAEVYNAKIKDGALDEDGEGGAMGGATSCASSGAYVGKMNGTVSRKIFKITEEQFAALKEQKLLTDSQIDEASTCASVMQGGGSNPEAGQYTVPFVGDKESLRRGDGVGGSTSVNIMTTKIEK
jgi:hypothetical protein